MPHPPVPESRPVTIERFGDERVDPWYWLADRDDPAVLEHLRAENAYTDAALAHLEPLRRELFDEMVARIAETDLSVPVRKGPWWYYQRTVEGENYAIHCRRPVDPGAGPDAAPPLTDGPGADEVVLLDENEVAAGHDYLALGNLAVSPDHTRLAYAVDTSGAERYELRFCRAGAGLEPDPPETVPDTSYGLAWANDDATVFYTRLDESMRPYQVWRHRLGTDPAGDHLVAEESDARFTLAPWRTRDGRFVVISAQSTTTSEIRVVPADRPEAEPEVVVARHPGVEAGLEHLGAPGGGPGWFLVVTNAEAADFRLVARPVGGGPERAVLPHRPGTRLDDVEAFDGALVVSERLEAEASVRVVPLDPGPDPFGADPLGRSWLVAAAEHPAATWVGPNPETSSPLLRIEQTSLVTPRTVSDVALADGTVTVRKRQPVLGPFRSEDYRTERLWVTAPDGEAVPVSLVARRDQPPGPAPLVLYGYGAYEHSIDPAFSSLRLSLLDRGVAFAIAHVRGGGERGRRWYEEGKLTHKPTTFGDFVAVARALVAEGRTAPDRLVARGGSAGGMLMGAAANLAPDLFTAIVAEVPFVDCLTTMLDASLPLTVGEWEEWGNPDADPEAYAVMRSYSPVDNVAAVDAGGRPVRYPVVLATAGLSDPRVGYWEPAKWVARLRAANPENVAYLRTELGAGHGGPSGRYDAWREEAFVVAFILDVLGLAADA